MQVPSFQTCQSQSERDLIMIRAVYGLIIESEEWNYSAGSSVGCFNCADKKRKVTHKCVWQKVKITESLPTPAGCLLSRLCMSFQMNGRLLAKIYRREGKRKRVKYFFFLNKRGNNINWHRTRKVSHAHLCSLPTWAHKTPCCTRGSAGREPTAAGISVVEKLELSQREETKYGVQRGPLLHHFKQAHREHRIGCSGWPDIRLESRVPPQV